MDVLGFGLARGGLADLRPRRPASAAGRGAKIRVACHGIAPPKVLNLVTFAFAHRLIMDETTADPMSSAPGGTPTSTAQAARGRSEAPIRARILQAILERRLHPGEKLTEDRVAELFGVSRTVVRQALARLAQDGIVEQHPHRGAFVAAPSRADARHVLQARAVVEPAIASAACGCPPAALARLRHHLAQENAARAAGERATLVRLTGEFHIALAEAAGNPVFVRLLTELQALSSLAILLYARGEHAACPPDEHTLILAAIEAEDLALAAERMRVHLGHVADEMDLSEPQARPAGLAAALGLAQTHLADLTDASDAPVPGEPRRPRPRRG